MWRDDDIVEVFGAADAPGGFLSQVRDPATGQWIRYVDENRDTVEPLMADAGADHSHTLVNAVLDTGIVHDHPVLANRIAAEVDFTGEGLEDLSGHGTVVALRFVSSHEDRDDIQIANVKITDRSGRGSPRALLQGLEWVTAFTRDHAESTVIVNVSAGVFRRRLFGVKPCDGTCDICRAAAAAADAGALVIAASGNTAGKTACPATIGVRDPDSGVLAVTVVGGTERGVGALAVAAGDLFVAQRIQPDTAPRIVELEDREADDHAAQGSTYAARAQASMRLAQIAMTEGRPDDAEKYLTSALEAGHEPSVPLAAMVLGHLLSSEGDPERAAQYLDLAMTSLDPEVVASAQLDRARMRRRLGMRGEAYADYRDLAARSSGVQALAQLGLGSFLADDGRLREAVQWLAAAAESGEDDVAARAELGIGDIAASADETAAAATYYRRAAARRDRQIAALAADRLRALD